MDELVLGHRSGSIVLARLALPFERLRLRLVGLPVPALEPVSGRGPVRRFLFGGLTSRHVGYPLMIIALGIVSAYLGYGIWRVVWYGVVDGCWPFLVLAPEPQPRLGTRAFALLVLVPLAIGCTRLLVQAQVWIARDSYAADLLSDGHGGVGYLLKDRVGALDDFLDALARVAAGGSAMDPEVVAQLITRSRDDRLGALSGREREVLGLMAEGLSNTAIAERLVLALPSVEKHIGNILTKLDLPPSHDVHRRVLTVLAHLDGR